jgi:sodium/bile acid cotransporter 7
MSADSEKGQVLSRTETMSEKDTTDGTAARGEESRDRADNSTAPAPPAPKKSFLRRVIRFMQDQWFLITLGILIAISSQHQVPKEHQHTKSLVVTYLCVSIIFFLTGCTLKTQTLIDNYSRWKLHLFVQVQSFLMTSIVMFGIVSAAATNRNFMDPGLLIGMIMTGCVATTISSNVVMV